MSEFETVDFFTPTRRNPSMNLQAIPGSALSRALSMGEFIYMLSDKAEDDWTPAQILQTALVAVVVDHSIPQSSLATARKHPLF